MGSSPASSMEGDRHAILRHMFDKELMSLGSSIYQTIMWYMDGRGVFSNPRAVDVQSLYANLREIVGPHADMIMDMVWAGLEKQHGARDPEKKQSLGKIAKWLDEKGGAA